MMERNMSREAVVRELTLQQVRALYAQRMRDDFPPDELKPLSMIEKALARGEYVCYGYEQGGEVLAYAFFVKRDGDALFDYYAVRRDLRDRGVGSRFIQALVEGPLRAWTCVLLEVEEPDLATDAEEARTRNRRLQFYLRNGLLETGVRAEVYHVTYRILALPVGEAPTPARTRQVYGDMYRIMLPGKLYDRMVRID